MSAKEPIVPTPDVDDVRHPGQTLWFEYRCWESPQSTDYELWLRSHQRVKVLGSLRSDGCDIRTFKERSESGHPLVYLALFADGEKFCVMEDELVDSVSEFIRPDPPISQEIT